jgi:hypothetical protein
MNIVDSSGWLEYFVTWNAKHFKGKTILTVLTPEEYLAL